MKHIIPIVLLLLSLTISCSDGNHKSIRSTEKLSNKSDTLVVTKEITDEIPGGNYRTRAKSYFLVINNDTSNFRPIFIKSKEGGDINIHMNLQNFKRNATYKLFQIEFKRILTEAAKDFNLDSLKSLFMGRLILSGEIAIEMTNEYKQLFGQTDSIVDYDKVCQFLLKSRWTNDINRLLKPYSIYVDAFYPEHIWFTTKQELYTFGNVELDSVLAPKKIFDCLTWIGLKKDIIKN